MPRNDDLDELGSDDLLRSIVGELRALRRLVGTIFILGTILVLVLPVLALVDVANR